ncbi:MAG: terminase family protein, partial [Deltaproteobacteria bacterium]|nr:terminase family protein [Deltaproteobacteria bacterium]
MSYSKETIQSARQKYLSGQSDDEIAKTLNIAPRTVRNWRIDQNWDLSQGDYVERLRAKVLLILGSENPNQGQLALAEKLNNQILSHERALAKQSQKSQANQGKGGRHKSKNSFEGINLDDIKEPSLGRTKPKDHKIARGEKPFFYRFQQAFIKDEAFVRFVLKSRQLGFSWVVAWEALWDALKTGKNKIFLSASKKQVGQIRSYIRKLAKSVFGVTLVGTDCITITNPAGEEVEFHFLSTNCVTAQSFHGDVYIDEACWIPKFRDLLDVALAMAIQDDYRVTYVSTPSTKSHHSYRIWAGLDDDDKPIKDEISRHSITLDQAIKEGYDRISWKKIKKQFRYT